MKFKEIEKKWQNIWEKEKSFEIKDFISPQCYILDMFPYPSGHGLHVGHFKGYVATDIFSRFKRMKGFNVLHPMGWDAFGLPAENYAIKTGIHPEITTKKNIDNIRNQMKITGLSYDWSREINTTDPNYYKWTQWIFLKLFEKGLAYKKMLPINWCPSCKTGLANEEVVDGKCERCGTETIKKNINQWVLKITDYADKLLEDLDSLDWPEKIKEMQKNWIGKSEGWEIDFKINNISIPIFTTRVDTLFGCTYLVLSPEHDVINQLEFENKKEVNDYIEKAKNKSERERISEVRDKTGLELKGIKAINPINQKQIPVFVADYVLAHYGTGAVMAVPAHDERDFDFAKKYNLEVIYVIDSEKEIPHVLDGVLFNSGEFNGLNSLEAREKIGKFLNGKKKINYKLRDWIFSRQRYWGEPIPIIHCEKCGMVPDYNLPVKLPHIDKYEPTGTGESPLALINDWVNVKCPQCNSNAKRETNTMPQWAGSSWYYLRFIDPNNNNDFVDEKKEKFFMPVDLYVGGAEHAVLHLLYARFWHRFLFDINLVSTKEPFLKLKNVGLILASDGQKMSKSKNNTVSPDEIIEKYGADTLRAYEMFMGPFEQAIIWNEQGVKGIHKFLNKIWGFVVKNKDNKESEEGLLSEAHKLNKKVSENIEKMKFNTAIAFFMEFLNLVENKKTGKDVLNIFILTMYPFIPHLCSELWEEIGNKEIEKEKWPEYDKELIKEKTVEIVVQINGKLRERIEVDYDFPKTKVKEACMEKEKVKKWIEGKEIKNILFIPNKLINFILK